MSWQRIVGWTVVVAVLSGCAITYWVPASTVDDIKLTDEQTTALAAMSDTGYSAWLTRYYRSLDVKRSSKQVVLLQGVPNEPPLVIASIQDADGDEEPTHWRAPWPEVAHALATGRLDGPQVVRSRYGGFDYAHHLIPFDQTHTRCLLVNEMSPAPSVFGFRMLVAFAMLTLAARLIAKP